MSAEINLVVPEGAGPERLDRYVASAIGGVSRTRVKRAILAGTLVLNGEPARPSDAVAPGDTIEGEVPESDTPSAEPESIPLDVRYEDDDVIVVNKPAGMVVHPAPGSPSGTLVNALLGRGGGLSGAGGELRPGIVHRLDRDTSGVILVAKHDRAHARLATMFEERKVSKLYLAIVWGALDPDGGRLEEPIGRRRSDRKRMGIVADGRFAATSWRVREEYEYASVAEIRPETGRTHQIRVHMAHAHHPVVGDAEYGGVRRSFGDVAPHLRRRAKRLNALAARQALHAREISFEHPTTEERLTVVAPLPPDFADLLAALRHPEGERGRAIGVDPGEARIGLAVSDERRVLASSLPTLEGLSDEAAAAAIAAAAEEREADTVVVGQPLRMDGSIGERARRAEDLAAALEDRTLARVVLWDERLSTAEAERVMRETGERARGRKGRVDAIAAAVILQSYLDAMAGPAGEAAP